ncbi:MAG: hypothetical protein ABI789_07210 [Usitatibacter sp.]
MARPISSSDLYDYMVAEFAKVRPSECSTCVVPKPFWGPSAGTGSVYWYMEPAANCPSGCRQLIAQIWAKATTDFEISPPSRVAMTG